MSQRIDNFIIREADGVRFAKTLVLGQGVPLSTTAGGLPELEQLLVGETQLMPSGGDDTGAIRAGLARTGRVRLGPGDFVVTEQIDLGTGQSVAGCGPERTRILTGSAPAPLQGVFRLTGSGPAVEGMSVAGVLAQSAADVRIHHLRVTGAQVGVKLDNVVRGEVSRIVAEDAGTGVSVTGGGRILVSDVTVQWSGSGLVLSQVEGARCAGLGVLGCHTAVNAGPGRAFSFESVQITECTYGLSITTAHGVAVSGLHTDLVEKTAVKVTGSSAVALVGCSVRSSELSLHIDSSTAVTVDGFLSDLDVVPGPPVNPHVVVGSGSTQVRIAGIHHINPRTWGPPQYEVDVSGAGGRVVFIQHDFDPARINSGGNFAAL